MIIPLQSQSHFMYLLSYMKDSLLYEAFHSGGLDPMFPHSLSSGIPFIYLTSCHKTSDWETSGEELWGGTQGWQVLLLVLPLPHQVTMASHSVASAIEMQGSCQHKSRHIGPWSRTEPRNESTLKESAGLWQRRREYPMGKRTSLVSGVGKNG